MLKILSLQRKGANEKTAKEKTGYQDRDKVWGTRRNELFYKILDHAAAVLSNDTFELRRLEPALLVLTLNNFSPYAEDLLDKALGIARKVEDFSSEINLLNLRKRAILGSDLPAKEKMEALRAAQARETELLSIQAEATSYKQIAETFYASPMKLTLPPGADHNPIAGHTAPPPLRSAKAKIYYHKILFSQSLFSDDDQGVVTQCQCIVEIFRHNMELLDDPTLSMLAIQNVYYWAYFLYQGKRYSEGDAALKSFSRFGFDKTHPDLCFEHLSVLKIKSATEKVSPERAKVAIRDFESEVSKHQYGLSDDFLVKIHFLIAKMLLITGDPSGAAFWSLKNFKNKLTVKTPLTLLYARIIFLLSKCELREWDEVNQNIRSIRSFFGVNNYLNTFFQDAIDGIESLSSAPESKHKQILSKFHKQMVALENRPEYILEKSFYPLSLHIKAWIQKKLIGELLKDQG